MFKRDVFVPTQAVIYGILFCKKLIVYIPTYFPKIWADANDFHFLFDPYMPLSPRTLSSSSYMLIG